MLNLLKSGMADARGRETGCAKMMRTRIAYVMFAFFLASCGQVGEQRLILVLFDLSGSTASGDIREDYKKYFDTVVDGLKGGDTLMVARIDAHPLGKSILEFKGTVPRFNFVTDNERKYKIKRAKEKRETIDAVEQVLKNKVKVTPIIDTLLICERLIKSQEASNKIIIIMSDMVEESKNYNFAREKLSDARIEKIIQGLKESGRIPDLRGATVYVAGARNKDIDKGLQIKKFWGLYFREAGALGLPENYGAELLSF